MPSMTRAGYTPPKPEPKKAPPKPPRKGKKKKRKGKKGLGAAGVVSLLIFALAALVGAATLYVYSVIQPYTHTYVPGTMLSGYPLAGATREDSEALLAKIVSETVDPWQFTIECMGQHYSVTAEDVHLTVNAEETLAPLFAAGHTGSMLDRFIEMMKLRREPLIASPVLQYDLAAVDSMLESILLDAEYAPVDAAMTYHPGSAEPFRFTPEETGRSVDLGGMRERIERALQGLETETITIEPETLEPEVYQAELEEALSLRARVVSEAAGDEATKANVRLAAGMLSGIRLDAGEALSFNETVGRRTAEAGYVPAQEPAYGVGAAGVGGGVCQVSTALYRAALLGGVSVTSRSGAARPVDYCGMGQEAAVSDQGLDLVIQNDTAYPLFISARTYEEEGALYLEMTIIGDKLAGRAALESSFEETGLIEEPVYIRDREGTYAKYDDERIPVGDALPGYTATVARIVYGEDGSELSRSVVSQDTYEAIPPTIYVGIEERE